MLFETCCSLPTLKRKPSRLPRVFRARGPFFSVSVSDVIGEISDVIGGSSDVIGGRSDVIGESSDVVGESRRE